MDPLNTEKVPLLGSQLPLVDVISTDEDLSLTTLFLRRTRLHQSSSIQPDEDCKLLVKEKMAPISMMLPITFLFIWHYVNYMKFDSNFHLGLPPNYKVFDGHFYADFDPNTVFIMVLGSIYVYCTSRHLPKRQFLNIFHVFLSVLNVFSFLLNGEIQAYLRQDYDSDYHNIQPTNKIEWFHHIARRILLNKGILYYLWVAILTFQIWRLRSFFLGIVSNHRAHEFVTKRAENKKLPRYEIAILLFLASNLFFWLSSRMSQDINSIYMFIIAYGISLFTITHAYRFANSNSKSFFERMRACYLKFIWVLPLAFFLFQDFGILQRRSIRSDYPIVIITIVRLILDVFVAYDFAQNRYSHNPITCQSCSKLA